MVVGCAEEPFEPIIAVDDVTDPQVLACPMTAATKTIAQAAEKDPLSTFFAKPGAAKEFAAALSGVLRARHTYDVHEMQQFDCVAFVLDTADHPLDEEPQQPLPDAQAMAAATQEGATVEELVARGFSRPAAELATLTRPERAELLWQLDADLQTMRAGFVRDHGPMLHVHVLACQRPGAGLGSRMLQHLGAVADAEHKWLLAEASSEAAARLFQRQGFKLRQDLQVGGEEGRAAGAPVLRILARAPAGGSGEAGDEGPVQSVEQLGEEGAFFC